MNDELKEQASQLGSNELIAHTMAQRILAQVSSGKNKESVMKDFQNSKEALKLA